MMKNSQESDIRSAIQTALESALNPANAAADWLARDIDPNRSTAVELLGDPDASLETLRRAKSVYKTMRILGETPADRHIAGRYYAAAIAAALLLHGERISTQSKPALRRGLRSLSEDLNMAPALRALADGALELI